MNNEKRKVTIMGNWAGIKGRLFLSVCSTEEADAFEGILYESIGPLALVPRILLKKDNEGVEAGYFSEDTVKSLGVSPEEVLAQAKRNGEHLFPTGIMVSSPMLMVSSFRSFDDLGKCPYGGAQLFYDGNLEYFRKKIGKDYYIIPSSKHEMMLLPAEEDFEPEKLLETVKMVNRNKYYVPEEDKIGDFVLLYRDGKVSVAAAA